jgi:hypothetical protein
MRQHACQLHSRSWVFDRLGHVCSKEVAAVALAQCRRRQRLESLDLLHAQDV